MIKQYNLKINLQEKIIEGLLSDEISKAAIEAEMENACLAILHKQYSKLGKDLQKYLEIRFPDGAESATAQQPERKPRIRAAQRKKEDMGEPIQTGNSVVEPENAQDTEPQNGGQTGYAPNSGYATNVDSRHEPEAIGALASPNSPYGQFYTALPQYLDPDGKGDSGDC